MAKRQTVDLFDERPIPRYMMGIPSCLQETILRTVEHELELATKNSKGRLDLFKKRTQVYVELQTLKALLATKGASIRSLDYSPKLAAYIPIIDTKR